MEKITFDDFIKVEMKIGKILNAVRVEGSEKLLQLSVDFGEEAPRQVISGIAKQFVVPVLDADANAVPAEDGSDAAATAPRKEIVGLVGNSFVFITNLEPRMIMGLESQAMIVAGTAEIGLALMTPTIDLPPGTKLS